MSKKHERKFDLHLRDVAIIVLFVISVPPWLDHVDVWEMTGRLSSPDTLLGLAGAAAIIIKAVRG